MKNPILIAFIAVCLTACGGAVTNVAVNTNTNSVNTASNTNANTANTNTANANANANANAAKPADSGPKRISFGKGQTNGSENVTLAPGESKKFVIGVKAGQILSIDSSAKDATISIITKGKTADANEEDGHYDASTTADGDIVFQISNATKKAFKSSINVSIDFQGE
ncbi:MAG: hypothetical protein ACKVQJ_15435 [Pyrinomonadaceae bacterium]